MGALVWRRLARAWAGSALLLAALSLRGAIGGTSRGPAHGPRAPAPVQGWDLVEPRPAVAFRPPALDALEELACSACHADVAREWAQSAHGLAWVDEVYRAEIADRKRPENCQPCHIPSPLLSEGPPGRPRLRSEGLRFGVDCQTCHLGPGGVILGASGAPTEAHPTRRSEHLSEAGAVALCAACHAVNIGPVIGVAKDFEVSRQAERGRSCVGCHLALVERASAAGGVPRRVRSHALQTPRDPSFLRRAFELSLVRDGAGGRVVVSNRAGHRVPGLIGREIRLAAEALAEDGSVLERGSLTIDTRMHLPVDGQLSIPLARLGDAVRVVGQHLDPRAELPVQFLDERLTAGEN